MYPIVIKYCRQNVTFVDDFNVDLTRKMSCPRSTLFFKLLTKNHFVPCLPLTSTRFVVRKSDINNIIIDFMINNGVYTDSTSHGVTDTINCSFKTDHNYLKYIIKMKTCI